MKKNKINGNNGSSGDLFDKIKLQMVMKIRGLSEKGAKEALAETGTKGRRKATARKTEMEGGVTAEEFFL